MLFRSLTRSPEQQRKIFRMTDFSSQSSYNFIPDPYYGDATDFELVIDLLEDACEGLVKYLENETN